VRSPALGWDPRIGGDRDACLPPIPRWTDRPMRHAKRPSASTGRCITAALGASRTPIVPRDQPIDRRLKGGHGRPRARRSLVPRRGTPGRSFAERASAGRSPRWSCRPHPVARRGR